MKKFGSCPFCGNKINKKYSYISDRLMTTKKTFSVYECEKCEAGILNPAPVEEAAKFYPTFYLSSEKQDQEKTSFDLEKWYRYNQYRFDFKLLKHATGLVLEDATSYIDIGCGSGERVMYAHDIGCKKPYGLDKFDFAKNQSKRDIGIINSEILDYKPKNKFQVASLFHVLEHLDNPYEVLAHISSDILAKNGYLIIQVPNYGSFERRIFKSRWFGLDVPRHYWDFNEKALRLLLEQNGYKVEDCYQLNASLHPVTIVPSIFRELDVQRIWVNKNRSDVNKKLLKVVWAGMTLATIPLAILQNIFNRSSMLTIIASNK